MEAGRVAEQAPAGSVGVFNAEGRGRIVLVCDHASNFVPSAYGTLGLPPADLLRHIAWDPGAFPVAMAMSQALDAPLVAAGVSRLIADCNRPLDAPDLVPEISETTVIPGNAKLDREERERRVAVTHQPFHAAIEALVERRMRSGVETWMVSVHTFTPVYKDEPRPWQVGIIHDDDTRIASPLIGGLRRIPGLTVGVNQPYSPADRVYFTLELHARSRGLPCAMIEIRNDEVSGEAAQAGWAGRLAGILGELRLADDRPAGSFAGTQRAGRADAR